MADECVKRKGPSNFKDHFKLRQQRVKGEYNYKFIHSIILINNETNVNKEIDMKSAS